MTNTNIEPTLGDLFKDIWRARIFVFVGALIGLAIGFGYLSVSVPKYKVSMLLSPTSGTGGSPDLASLLPNNSGFALEYMMQSFSPGDSSDFMRFEHIFRGVSAAKKLINNQSILDGIAKDRDFKFFKVNKIANSEDLAAYLYKSISFEPVGSTPMRRISYLHPDPEFAKTLLSKTHGIADIMIRGDMMKKTKGRIAYLNRTIASTNHPDHRKALTSLLMEQEHVRMILSLNEAYAAAIIEPPSSISRPYHPRKSLVIIIALFIGSITGFLFSSLRSHK